MTVDVALVVLGLVLIVLGVLGALNVRRSRDRIVQINAARPPGDRARSVAGVTAWCAVTAAVGVLLVLQGVA